MADLTVDVHNLTRKFGDFIAVNQVNFQIGQGSIFGFLGPNGAGKSTTIRMLLGILTPTSGHGTVLGLDILTQSEKIRAQVGYMSQIFSLYEDLTVLENLEFFAGIFNLRGTAKKKRIDYLIDLARLSSYLGQLAADIPRGIRQRLSFAVSLVQDPAIVFLDEPTGGVDPSLRRYFWDVIVDLAESGKTMLVTTHYMDEVERCNRICMINDGCIIAQGTPTELKKTHLKGTAYECTTCRRPEVIETLREQPGVYYPFPAGDRVRFLLDENATTPEKIRQALKSKALETGEFKKASPTLEDVFVALIKK